MESEVSKPAEFKGFSPKVEERFQELLTHYPNTQAMVLPSLWLAQDQYGWISAEVMAYVAERLDVPASKVYSVATFYTMFNRGPVGKYHINVCTSPHCAIVGSDKILHQLEESLDIKCGETTPDGQFTLNRTECLASCGTAPMLECNLKYYERLDETVLGTLLEKWRNGA